MLAFDLRSSAEVSVAPEEVERVVDHSILPARGKFGLKFRKVGAAFMDYDYLPIDDGVTGNVEGASNDREPFSPVQPVARVELLPSTIYVNLHAIPVIFDFMEPLVALRCLGLQGGKLGLNEPRHLN